MKDTTIAVDLAKNVFEIAREVKILMRLPDFRCSRFLERCKLLTRREFEYFDPTGTHRRILRW